MKLCSKKSVLSLRGSIWQRKRVLDLVIVLSWSMWLLCTVNWEFIEINNSWSGYNLSEILDILRSPQEYRGDFVANAFFESFHRSIYFRFLSSMTVLFKQDSLYVQEVMIAAEIILASAAGYVLPRVVSKSGSVIESILSMILLTASGAVGYDWGRWAWMYSGQTYIFPYCLWIVSIIWLKKGLVIRGALCLAVGCMVHPIVGFLGTVSAVLYKVVVDWQMSRWTSNKNLCSMRTLFLIFVPTLVVLGVASLSGGNLEYDRIGAAEFVQWTKNSSYHWYPWTEGLFSREGSKATIFPYISIMLGATYVEIETKRQGKLSVRQNEYVFPFFIGSCLMAGIGVLLSEVSYTPTLIKLAIFRISIFPLIVAIPIIAKGLTRFLVWGNCAMHSRSVLRHLWNTREICLVGIVCFAYVVSALTGEYAWPVVYVSGCLGLLLLDYEGTHFGKLKLFTLSGIVGLSVYLLPSLRLAIKSPLLNTIVVVLPISLIVLSVMYVFWTARVNVSSTNNEKKVMVLTVGFTLGWIIACLLVGVSSFKRISSYISSNDAGEQMRSYHNLQKCAKADLPKGSIVMPPLDRDYGWRSTSKIPTTGSARSWVISWIYTSDRNTFEQSRESLKEIGMTEWIRFEHNPRGFNGIRLFEDELGDILNRLEIKDLKRIASNLGATHFVIDKKRNSSYAVLGTQGVQCMNGHYGIMETSWADERLK